MFVEYMSSKDKGEAKMLLDAGAGMKPSKEDELYITKEQDAYYAVLKIKMPRKAYDEQKWKLCPEEKGLRAKREWSTGYAVDLLVSGILGLACLMAVIFSIIYVTDRLLLLWMGMLFLLMFMLFTWKRMMKPSVALKIYLIRLV